MPIPARTLNEYANTIQLLIVGVPLRHCRRSCRPNDLSVAFAEFDVPSTKDIMHRQEVGIQHGHYPIGLELFKNERDLWNRKRAMKGRHGRFKDLQVTASISVTFGGGDLQTRKQQKGRSLRHGG